MVCIRSCDRGRGGFCPMRAPWMDSATSASTKTGIALFPTLSSTTGPAWESRTSIFWTRTSEGSGAVFVASSAAADAVASATPAQATRHLPSLLIAPRSAERSDLGDQLFLVDG